jgi:hyperosmotically inducible protein
MIERHAIALVTLLLSIALSGCDRGTPQQSEPAGSPPAPTQGENSTTGSGAANDAARIPATVEDTTVTAKVKAALLASDGIQATDISVETQQGVVILTGKVADASQAQRATEIAQSVEGVRSVDNRLTTS